MSRWELFAEATKEGLTLRAIRERLFVKGHDLSMYSDTELICRMLSILGH